VTLLAVNELAKTFPVARGDRGGPVVAVDGVSFSVPEGELFTLLGPSGCGKTTILRCIGGLEDPDTGEITVAGRTLVSTARRLRVPVNRRGLGMVFQSYAIWPHMNVFDNVAFPLTVRARSQRLPRRELEEKVGAMLELTRLSHAASRPATDLSGGQQQRLALARALVIEPPLLLLDEPLSSIDAKLRADMRFELRRLQQTLGVTTVYVTHDQEEALSMSTEIGVMRDGRIEQIGTPRDVYERPASRFVADFIGASNVVEGTVATSDNGTCLVNTPHGTVRVAGGQPFAAGSDVLVVIRAERMRFAGNGDGGAGNRWSGVVQTPAFLGGLVDHEVRVGDARIHVRTDPARAAATGDAVTVAFDEDACVLVARD
jgi:iron(III) transport system ATP-binding protein